MRTVLLERKLSQPLQTGETPNPESAICCTPELIRWRDSYVSSDRRRAYLLATAPDLESVRQTLRGCGADLHWKYPVEDQLLLPQVTPNTAVEVTTARAATIEDILTAVSNCAADSVTVRVLRQIGGPTMLILTRTPCHIFEPVAGLTIKSVLPLTDEQI